MAQAQRIRSCSSGIPNIFRATEFKQPRGVKSCVHYLVIFETDRVRGFIQ